MSNETRLATGSPQPTGPLLEERLGTLERRQRRLTIVTCLLLGLVVVVAWRRPSGEVVRFDKIEARHISVTDPGDYRTWIEISALNDSAQVGVASGEQFGLLVANEEGVVVGAHNGDEGYFLTPAGAASGDVPKQWRLYVQHKRLMDDTLARLRKAAKSRPNQ